MQWWCAAQGIPWSWSWQAYPGVWLFVALLCVAYVRLTRGVPRSRGQVARFACGVLALWVALDWPVGALGSGYLASVHMVQFLLIALTAPPLLISALPRAALEGARGSPPARVLAFFARPLIALLLFQVIVIATHWPAVVDGLMASQAGSLLLDAAWLAGGLIFWWPVASPVPRRIPPGVRICYLIACTVLMTLPYIFLTFAELPFYATYELAPPVGTLSAEEDQRLAGLIMRIGGGAILWTAAGVVFGLWYRAEGGRATPSSRS